MRNPAILVIMLLIIMSFVPIYGEDSTGHVDNPFATEEDITTDGSRADGFENDSVTFTSGDCTVPGNLYYPTSGTQLPAIVFGVGYTAQITGLFDSSNYEWIAGELASRGYVVLVVRYCADYTNPSEFLDLLDNYTQWVNQTRDAITALEFDLLTGANTNTAIKVDRTRIGLGGHSIGGAVSIVAGTLDRRVKCVFVMTPQNYAGTPRYNSYVDELTPVPIQLQVGEADALGGLASVQQTYGLASSPKQMVTYRYGTYEGFTQLGVFENIEISGFPVTTKQHAYSKNYTAGFLDYYLKNSEGTFNFKAGFQEGYQLPIPPYTTVPNVWETTVTNSGLDTVIQDADTTPATLDLEDGNIIGIRARVTPKGIWETGVRAEITYPEGAKQGYDMEFDRSYDREGGYFYRDIPVSINHTLGEVSVWVNATDSEGVRYSSGRFTFELTTSSDQPIIDNVTYTPVPILPDEEVTFNVKASDKDGIAYYFYDFGDGTTTGWIDHGSSSHTQLHTFETSGKYTIKIWAKDSKAQESDPETITAIVSHKPEAKLKLDSKGTLNEEIEFDASGSSDEDEDELMYFFKYGDGVESGWVHDAKVGHEYSEYGSYDVVLIVRDEHELESDPVTKTIRIQEEEEESTLKSITSSSGFPIIVLIVIACIGGFGYFLLKNGEEDDRPGGQGMKASLTGSSNKGKKKKPGIHGAAHGAGPGKPGKAGGTSSKPQDLPHAGAPVHGQHPHDIPPDATGRPQGGNVAPQSDMEIDAPPVSMAGSIPTARVPPVQSEIDAPPVPPVSTSAGQLPQTPDPQTRATPPQGQPRTPPQFPQRTTQQPQQTRQQPRTTAPPMAQAVQPAQPVPSSDLPPERTVQPTVTQPSEPQVQPQTPPPAAPSTTSPAYPPPQSQPDTTAAPVPSAQAPVEESWDDAEESGGEEDPWGDDDFAIPVALKEKLMKEQE